MTSSTPPPPGTTRLYRPTGPKERDLVAASGWRAWPPRLPEQPIFYPVMNEWYATKIAREWNVPHAGVGYVCEFDVTREYLADFDRAAGGRARRARTVGSRGASSSEFNAHIVGGIREIARYDTVSDDMNDGAGGIRDRRRRQHGRSPPASLTSTASSISDGAARRARYRESAGRGKGDRRARRRAGDRGRAPRRPTALVPDPVVRGAVRELNEARGAISASTTRCRDARGARPSSGGG